MAGPLGGHQEYRGIVVYNVTSEEEALQLAHADPAVKARRLAVEIFSWWAAKGTSLF